MENRCQERNTLFSLAISAVMGELSHILNENKILHFHQSYLDKNLETFDFFPYSLFPANPSSSPGGSTSKIYPESNCSLHLHSYCSCPSLDYCNSFVLGLHSVANNKKLNRGSFDKQRFICPSKK